MKLTMHELVDQLRTTGAYTTPARIDRHLGGRLFGWSDAWYHWQVIRAICEASRQARCGVYDRQAWMASSFRIMRQIEEAGGRLDISGVEHLAALDGPAVCISNHMSLLETFHLPVIILPYQELTFVVKKSLLDYPVFGPVMRAVEPISVSRQNPREDLRTVMTEGVRFLRSGRLVTVFPQATRSACFDPARFNSLGAKLAARAGVPVLPLALKTDFAQNGRLIKDFGKLNRSRVVRFKFGRPLEGAGKGRDVHQAVVTFISEHLREWGGRVRSEDERA